MSKLGGVRALVNQAFQGQDAFHIVQRTIGGVLALYLLAKVATNGSGMFAILKMTHIIIVYIN